MEAIILAGGLGTRLQAVVKDVPKPMADIHGRPFLSYVLDLLSGQGVLRVLLSVGYKHEVIERHFGSRYGEMGIEYIVEQEPRGTGGAVREALRSCRGKDVFVLNGDTFFVVDLRKMLAYHREKHADLTIALKPMDRGGRYGTVIREQDGRISGFREKSDPGPGTINGGVYVLQRRIEEQLTMFDGLFSLERDFLEKNIGRIAAYGFVSDGSFIDIGVPDDYARARMTLLDAVGERWK